MPQRVWGIRVDSVLRLDRATKPEWNADCHEEVAAEIVVGATDSNLCPPVCEFCQSCPIC
jgi:hypothetical protein